MSDQQGMQLINPDFFSVHLGKLLRVSDDIHRMTEFVMEIRKVSIVLGIIGIITIIIYGIVKISRKHFEHKRQSKRRLENMMETLSRVNARNTMNSAYVPCRTDMWHTQRIKRCSELDGDVCGLSVHTPNESCDDIGPKLDDLRALNGNTSKSVHH